MTTYASPYFPRPEDKTPPVMYRWAKETTRWFENWVSSHTGTGTISTYQIPSYTMNLHWSNDIWLGGTVYATVYRDAIPVSAGCYDLHWSLPMTVGPIGTSRFRNTQRAVINPNNAGASGLVTLLKAGSWSMQVKVFGPFGLVDSVTASKA
jgi:hypothetical protein